MPKITYLQTNFTAGEMSPRLRGRVDIARYANGAAQVTNALPLIHGGLLRRYGTRYVAEVKDSTKRVRLIPFVFSRDQSYMLEFGDSYLRFYTAGAQIESAPAVPYEIATPYTEAMLDAIDFAQGADTMFLVHPSVPVQRLRRFADASWDMSAAPWVFEPFAEQGIIAAATLTLSSAAVGTGRTFTAGSATFLASDVGRRVTSAAGIAEITGYTSTTVVTATILVAFPSTSIVAGAWTIEGSPQATCTASAATPVGATITLTLSAAGWRAADVGKLVKINGGLVQITAFTSDTIVGGRIETALSSATGAPADSWSLESSVWSAANGYPRAVTFHEQRLVLGGSRRYPQTIWGSVPNESLNFLLGPDDDDAFSFEIASDQINPIAYLASLNQLAVFTYGGEVVLYGGTDKPITPTNVQVKPQSPHGCELIKPVRVGQEMLFVQRGGRKVRAFGYRAESDGYLAEDVSLLAEHITAPSLVSMACQQEPDPFVWAVRSDGAMITCTLDRAQQVVAWARHPTDGEFESVAVIPVGDEEQVWVVVKRNITSADVRYIERLDTTLHTDCAYTNSDPSPQTVWSGLGYLDTETVDVVADGSYVGRLVVAAGLIEIPRAALSVEIGLPYQTFVELLTPEIQGAGSTQASQMRTNELTVRLLETQACEVNGAQVAFRQFGLDVLDSAPPLVTGDLRLNDLGWDRGQSVTTLSQSKPLRWHVLAAIRKFTWNEG